MNLFGALPLPLECIILLVFQVSCYVLLTPFHGLDVGLLQRVYFKVVQ